MRKNVEDEELQKIVRILTKSVSLKLNNLWPKKFGYDLGTKAVEFVEGGKCIKGAQPFVESLRDELSGIKHKGRSIKEALQNPLLPSRMKQKCSVRFSRTASKNAVFLP